MKRVENIFRSLYFFVPQIHSKRYFTQVTKKHCLSYLWCYLCMQIVWVSFVHLYICLNILYVSEGFLPSHQYNGAEWNYIYAARSTEKALKVNG